MKYSKVIFLLTVMLLAFSSSSTATPCNDTKQREYTISEYGLENEISEFADELRKYRSVQTQPTEHNAIKRNSEQPTHKRISGNKSGASYHSKLQQSRPSDGFVPQGSSNSPPFTGLLHLRLTAYHYLAVI